MLVFLPHPLFLDFVSIVCRFYSGYCYIGFLKSILYDLRISFWGSWMAQLAKHLTLAQVMISQLVDSSPMSAPAQTAQSLEPASVSVPPCLCPSLIHTLCVSLSKEKINKINKYIYICVCVCVCVYIYVFKKIFLKNIFLSSLYT